MPPKQKIHPKLPKPPSKQTAPMPKSERKKRDEKNATKSKMASLRGFFSGPTQATRTFAPFDKYEYIGAAGNRSLAVTLEAGQAVLAEPGAMAYMDGTVQVHSVYSNGGIKGLLGRLASGESLGLKQFEGPGRVVFSVDYPGDVVEIPLVDGQGYKMNPGAFLACTGNVEISGRLNLIGALGVGTEDGLVLSTATAKGGSGRVFMACYGHIEKHVLKPGQSLIIDHENFLACPSEVEYTITNIGNKMKLLFSSEGLAIKIDGPCTAYTQTKGLRGLAKALYPYLPQNAGGGASGSDGVSWGNSGNAGEDWGDDGE